MKPSERQKRREKAIAGLHRAIFSPYVTLEEILRLAADRAGQVEILFDEYKTTARRREGGKP